MFGTNSSPLRLLFARSAPAQLASEVAGGGGGGGGGEGDGKA